MSDIMLIGVLKMPPECWLNDDLDNAQRYARYLEAAKRIEDLERSVDFYKSRCAELQRVQKTMRDPERKMVCDILANGCTSNVTGEGCGSQT